MTKKIEAMVRNEKLYGVQSALDDVGACGMTSYEVRGAGNQKGTQQAGGRPGSFKSATPIPKTKIKIMCDYKDVESLVATISKAARTGNVGDGKIFVYPLDNVVRIRTGKSRTTAI